MPLHQSGYSLYCSLYISCDNDKENTLNDYELLKQVIISLLS